MARESAYLIDANNYIFRAYHAIPPMTAIDGRPTNATYGFVRTLLKLVRERQPDWGAAIFEGPVSFRKDLYPQYKQNRVEPPNPLKPQFADSRRAATVLGFPCLEAAGYEADDLIGTLAERLRASGLRVVLVSGDKDMAQLVGENITLLDIARDEEFDAAKVAERFGVRPEQIPDLLALHGDAIDNIPGIPGIGTKTAQILLQAFPSLDDIAACPDRIEGLSIRNAAAVKHRVTAGLETAHLARRLATIARDVPFDLDLDLLRYRGADRAQVEILFDALAFGPRVRGEIPRWADPPVEGFSRRQPGASLMAADSTPLASSTRLARRDRPHTILFVCLGNLCRSPLAEGLLKRRLAELGLAEGYQVRSAGIIAREGNVPPLDAVRAAADHRVDLSHHSATPLTSQLIADTDLVVAMDRSNVEHILNLAPDLGPRLRLLKQYARGARGFDIPDPMGYPIEIFRESYREIEEGIAGLIETLAPGHGPGVGSPDSASPGQNPS